MDWHCGLRETTRSGYTFLSLVLKELLYDLSPGHDYDDRSLGYLQSIAVPLRDILQGEDFKDVNIAKTELSKTEGHLFITLYP